LTVVARRVAAVPKRTAVETWQRVVELVSAPDSAARDELAGVTSVAAMLIADEQTKDEAITISGGGPLVRVYTVHGDEAVEHDYADEANLVFNPTSGDDWTLTLPAAGVDVAIVEMAIADAPHVAVRDVDSAVADADRTARTTVALDLDLSELERP
jgi:hypothetical protein